MKPIHKILRNIYLLPFLRKPEMPGLTVDFVYENKLFRGCRVTFLN